MYFNGHVRFTCKHKFWLYETENFVNTSDGVVKGLKGLPTAHYDCIKTMDILLNGKLLYPSGWRFKGKLLGVLDPLTEKGFIGS